MCDSIRLTRYNFEIARPTVATSYNRRSIEEMICSKHFGSNELFTAISVRQVKMCQSAA